MEDRTILTKTDVVQGNVVYYESMKRKLKTRPLYECRYDERLKTKAEESTLLVYTVAHGTGIPKDKDEVNR